MTSRKWSYKYYYDDLLYIRLKFADLRQLLTKPQLKIALNSGKIQ